MSATDWIGSSQVIRSRQPSSRLAVLSSIAGSSIHASGRPSIQTCLRVHRHGCVAVAALHVDDVHAAQVRELSKQAVVPRGRRVQLEAEIRIWTEARAQRGETRGIPDPNRCDEVDRPRGTVEGGVQREAALAEGEVERRALECPAAVGAGAVADWLDREEIGQREQRRELVEGTGAQQPGEVIPPAEELDLVDLIPRDVLALALMPPAGEPHDDRDLGEPARSVTHQREQLAVLDCNRQPGDARVGSLSSQRDDDTRGDRTR